MEVLQRCNGLNVTLKTAVEIKIDRAEWKPWHEETEMWLWKYQLWNCEGSNTGVQKGSRMGLTNTCPLPQTDAHRMAESLLHLGCSTLFFSSELPVHHASRHHKFSSTSRILLSRLAPSGLIPKYPQFKETSSKGNIFYTTIASSLGEKEVRAKACWML